MAQHLLEHSFLFTNEEREAIYRSSSSVDTMPASFVTRIFYPIWHIISSRLLAPEVAPNAITLVGVLCSLQAYQLISTYYHYFGDQASLQREMYKSFYVYGLKGVTGLPPRNGFNDSNSATAHNFTTATAADVDMFRANRTVQVATVIAGLLLLASIMCSSVDGVHAKRCRSATSLGDIFSRVCSSLSRVFMALTMLEVMQIDDMSSKWYFLMTLQLIEFNTVLGRINANNLRKNKVKNWAYVATYCFRDSELSFLIVLLLICRWFYPPAAFYLQTISPAQARGAYVALICITFANIALLKMKKRHKSSIALCLAARVIPLFYILPLGEYNLLSVIGDAMVVGLLSIEVYVSHLARRRMHAAVIFISLGSLFNDVFAVVATVMYIVGILVDLSYSLNVPLFVPVRNVFIDGVFDLCHAGHKLMMASALKFGNRLIVGVCGDEECESYKRRPIMTTTERVNEVRLCKYVSEVIPNSPISGITEEMVRYYNIHVVVCGEEYDIPTDTYYAVPRKMGILRTAPRTEGISTSELIKRIRAASDKEVTAKDKLSGKSTVKDGA